MSTQTLSRARWVRGCILRLLLCLSAALVCALLAGLTGYILLRGLPHVTWQLLFTQSSVLRGTRGILPNLLLNSRQCITLSAMARLPMRELHPALTEWLCSLQGRKAFGRLFRSR